MFVEKAFPHPLQTPQACDVCPIGRETLFVDGGGKEAIFLIFGIDQQTPIWYIDKIYF